MAKIYGLLALLVTVIGAALGMKRYVIQNALRKEELMQRKHKDKQRKDMDDAEIDNLSSADEFITKRRVRRKKHKR